MSSQKSFIIQILGNSLYLKDEDCPSYHGTLILHNLILLTLLVFFCLDLMEWSQHSGSFFHSMCHVPVLMPEVVLFLHLKILCCQLAHPTISYQCFKRSQIFL